MTGLAVAPRLAGRDLTAIGVAVRVVVTDPSAADTAAELLARRLAELDLACSRFRTDSEIGAVNAAAGRSTPVGPLLAEAIEVALDAARTTGGAVDPTVGSSLVRLGYDGDFAGLPADGERVEASWRRSAHWSQVQLDRVAGTVRMPAGVQLDLGATAKAWAADRAAEALGAELGCGVLVSLGGDLAMVGEAPEGGWAVRVQDLPGRLEDEPAGPSCTVAVRSGGLATSSTAARRWRRGGELLHHLIDPVTGMPARSVWRTVTVAAPTCLAANVASTAAIVRSHAALPGLAAAGHPARLVDLDGEVTLLNGWPTP